MDRIDVARLRGILAEARVSHTKYAEACGLHRVYVGRILSGSLPVGVRTRVKFAHGLESLGLADRDREASHA